MASKYQAEKITAMQLKAARMALNLSVKEISDLTEIGVATIKRYEIAEGVPKSRKGHLELLKAFFEGRGIEFVGAPGEGPGIRVWGAHK
jgi:transcriptional regulator with XRE-family HTH domain